MICLPGDQPLELVAGPYNRSDCLPRPATGAGITCRELRCHRLVCLRRKLECIPMRVSPPPGTRFAEEEIAT